MKDITKLKAQAQANLDRAYQILGARPGPGVDIIIKPSNPVSNRYGLEGLTLAGKAFLVKLYPYPTVGAGGSLRRFKEDLAHWGLTFETDWSNVIDVKVDP